LILKRNIFIGSGGFGYLREIQWWAGLATMALGELCNFAAYGFAPASVVTPLGALSVLVRYEFINYLSISFYLYNSALMAARFLGEKLNTFGKIGCLLTIFGSIVIIIHAPKDSEVNSLLDFAHKIESPGMKILKSIIKNRFIELFFFLSRISFLFAINMYRNFMFNDILWSTFWFKIYSYIYINLFSFGCIYCYSM
jgi:hypothetical protein